MFTDKMDKSPISNILSVKIDAHCWEADVNSAKIEKSFPDF